MKYFYMIYFILWLSFSVYMIIQNRKDVRQAKENQKKIDKLLKEYEDINSESERRKAWKEQLMKQLN